MKIDRDGIRFALICALVTVFSFFVSLQLAYLCLFITLFVVYFFRDPERHTIDNNDIMVSPADGTILNIEPLSKLPEEFDDYIDISKTKYTKISIFMNIFNVHVNRAPINGKLEKIKYINGKFFNASLDKASEFNERNIFFEKTIHNEKIIFVQIAGLIARRIRCDVKQNSDITKQQKLGIIRFGSRVDLYLPENYQIMIAKGQKTISGETIIAEYNKTITL